MNTQFSTRTELFKNQDALRYPQRKPTKKLNLKREIVRVAGAGSGPKFGSTERISTNLDKVTWGDKNEVQSTNQFRCQEGAYHDVDDAADGGSSPSKNLFMGKGSSTPPGAGTCTSQAATLAALDWYLDGMDGMDQHIANALDQNV